MKKKILAILLVLMLILGALPVVSFAATEGTVKTTQSGGSLNLRAGPSTDHESLGYVQDGDAIIVNFQGTEWSNITVKKSGKSGYIKNKYIVTSSSGGWTPSGGGSSSTTATVYVSDHGGSLNLRAGEGTNTAIKGWVLHGDSITVLSKGSVWSKIKVARTGNTGYIKTKYIKTSGGGGSTPSGPSNYDVAVITTKTAGGQVNVRSGAGTSYSSKGTVGRGTLLKVTGTSGDWVKVTLENGTEGFVHKNYVSYGKKAVTTASSLNLRYGPGTSYGIMNALAKGTSVVVHSVSGNWAYVTAGSQKGYVYTQYIS